LQALAFGVPRLIGETGDIRAGSAEARDDASAQRIADRGEDDGNGRGRCLCRLRRERAESSDQHVRLGSHQLGRQRGQPLGMSLGRTVVETHICCFVVTKLMQPCEQRLHQSRVLAGNEREKTQAMCFLRSLGGRYDRPRGKHAEQCDELPPSHCLPRGSGQGIVPTQTSTLEGVGRVRQPMSEMGH
jgi:hypothetical protein